MTQTLTMQPLSARQLTPAQMHRAIGSLLGAAIGDALGARFEFGPAGQWSAAFPVPLLVGHGEMIGGGHFGWKPGEFTDDTQMAIALAESLVACDGFDAQHTFDRFRAWAGGATDIGTRTATALFSDRGWQNAAEYAHNKLGDSGSNGSVMRIAPVGIAGVRWGAAKTMEIARGQSQLTHWSTNAATGAVIVAELIRRVIITGEFNDLVDPLMSDVAELMPAEDVVEYALLLDSSFDPHTFVGPSNSSALVCVAQAVWAVSTTSSYADAVAAAINLGGDTDTVAAVAGALAGALYGIQQVPVRWVTHVNGSLQRPDGSVVNYANATLHDMARELLGLAAATRTPTEPPAGPAVVGSARNGTSILAANLEGATLASTDMAVVSMCITDQRFANHPHRREVYMRDEEGSRNTALGFAVREAVQAVDQYLSTGREVVVHCHGGRSRTGLILKAWHMWHHGSTHSEAHDWLEARWHLYATYNQTFMDFLDNEWPAVIAAQKAGIK
jgi:ADP-ribosyl-[dinitrogen reductase] hydrolase